MFDWAFIKSCPTQGAVLRSLCLENGQNNSDLCQNINLLIFFVRLECYSKGIFPLIASLLMIVGTVLNLCSLYCFLKMKKRHSTNIYLSVLSLGDTINLHVNFTLPILRQTEWIDNGYRSSPWLCRLMGVLTEFFLIFPTWIVVLLTMEPLIFLFRPSKRDQSAAQRRAKFSVLVLILIVLGLSLYRVVDLKGIDHVSVFSVVACNGSSTQVDSIRNINLIIWSILPEFCTLVMSLVIIYKISSAKKLSNQDHSKASQAKYNQATKTVLLISILFYIFHTPTGVLIALHLLFEDDKQKTLGIVIILVSRKLTVLLYEISLCCKFFIYNQTFRDFKRILRISFNPLIRRKNSDKIGRVVVNPPCFGKHQTFHFGQRQHSLPSMAHPTDSLLKSTEDHSHHRKRAASSTSASRQGREKQAISVMMFKNTEGSYLAFSKAVDSSKRAWWSGRPQATL